MKLSLFFLWQFHLDHLNIYFQDAFAVLVFNSTPQMARNFHCFSQHFLSQPPFSFSAPFGPLILFPTKIYLPLLVPYSIFDLYDSVMVIIHLTANIYILVNTHNNLYFQICDQSLRMVFFQFYIICKFHDLSFVFVFYNG